MSPILGLIQTLIIIALVFILVYKYIDIKTKNTHFECPHCRSSFKLSKSSFALALKKNSYERMVTCLVCGYKGWMEIIKDEK
jgi:transcription elongation factor Elf1